MKYIKLLLKLIVVLIVPYLFQFLGFILYGISQAIRLMVSGEADPDVITASIQTSILTATTSIIMYAALFVVIVFYLVHLSKKRNSMKVAYRFNTISRIHLIYTMIIGVFVCFFSIGLSGLLNIGSYDPEAVESLNNLVMSKSFLFTLLSVGIIVPISEEIVFRGSVLKNLSETLSVKWAIVIQALIFSVYHFNLVQAIPTLLIGLIMGLTVYYSNSILTGIIIHIFNNSLVVIMSHVLPSEFELLPLHYLITCLVSGLVLLVCLLKFKQNKIEFVPIEKPKLQVVE